MKKEQYSDKEVDKLAEQLRDDRLDEESEKDIREIIRNHPKERRRLVEHLYLGSAVREAVRTWSGRDERMAGEGHKFPRWAIALLGAAALAALLIFVLPHLKWVTNPNKQASDAAAVLAELEAQELKGIAVISHTKGAVWGGGTTLSSVAIRNGAPVGQGRIELFEGMAQIDFYSGAVLILQGPARLELKSPNTAELVYGSLRGKIPPPAKGFTIKTPNFSITNHHSEFGIRNSKEGQCELHVFAGQLEFKRKEGKNEILKAGQGVTSSPNGKAIVTSVARDNFPTWKEFDRESRARLLKWQDYQRALMAKEHILVGYLLTGDSAWERTVRNRALRGPANTDGAIVGCEWAEGRWPGKKSLAYSNSSHRIRLNLPGEYEALTLATWLKLDAMNSPEVSLLNPETRQQSFVHWTLVQTPIDGPHVHFSETKGNGDFKIPPNEFRNHYHANINLMRKGSTQFGDWVHLAVVYDPFEKQVRHYQNGELINLTAISEVRTLMIGNADIGNWPYQEWAQGTEFEVRNLDGQIGEFIISKKPWTDDEIRELWEVGRP